MGMVEIWDILDENGDKTGRTVVRGEPLLHGEYYLAVHIWIQNGKGEYLIQKRAADKPLWPGLWAATGGAAVSGEGSLDAALRETEEELGVKPDRGRLRFLGRLRKKDWFTDIWILEQDISLQSIVMQPGEVEDVRWVDKEQILGMVHRREFVEYSYLDAFLNSNPL